MAVLPDGGRTKGQVVMRTTRRALVALAVAAVLVPAVPAVAQTATPAPSPSATPTPSGTPTAPVTPVLVRLSVSRSLIDLGQTVDATVTGTPGTQVGLFLGNFRASQGRQIRTGTIGAGGSLTWTGLRPEDSVALSVRVAGSDSGFVHADVLVRRIVTIGVEQRSRGTYRFSGQITRAEGGVPITIARLDDRTGRVTGVAATRTTADGRYTVSTSLPQGMAGYYAIALAASGLEAGRSRLYGLLVGTTPTPAAVQAIGLDVGRSAGST